MEHKINDWNLPSPFQLIPRISLQDYCPCVCCHIPPFLPISWKEQVALTTSCPDPHPTSAPLSFVRAARRPTFRTFLLDQTTLSTVPLQWPSSQHSHLNVSPDAASVSPSPLLHLPWLPSSPPPFSLSSPSLFLFPSLSLVVDWVSECLWQLCVVCNRAERLVWIQRWENLFMWEMHRWRQVSRRCGLSPAVILHSGPDRRSEMAKYARRSPKSPSCMPQSNRRVFVFIQIWQNDSVCVCAWVCMCLQGSMLDQIPLPQGSVQGPLPLSDRGEKVYQLFSFYPIPVISFSDMLRLFSGAGIQLPVLHRDVCPAQTVHLAFSFHSAWCAGGCICVWMVAVCPS